MQLSVIGQLYLALCLAAKMLLMFFTKMVLMFFTKMVLMFFTKMLILEQLNANMIELLCQQIGTTLSMIAASRSCFASKLIVSYVLLL